MDISNILASQASKYKSIAVEKETPLDVDVGFLVVTDPNPVDEEAYTTDLEGHLQSTARDGVQLILSSLFSLPTQSTGDGPLAILPSPSSILPRAKHLPKPKPPTKWERFAAAKGIQKTRKDKKVWDEERQDWVDRWGKHGKNKEKEEQWITEVPANADIGYDPVKEARDARKERVAKNERQRAQNTNRSQAAVGGRAERKREIEKTLATSRTSTASMGKFDKKLEGEKKLRGIKRKFDPIEAPVDKEKTASLAIISKLDGTSKKSKRDHGDNGEESLLNVRKAVRFASKGRGGIALTRESSRGRGGRARRGGKR